MKNAMKPKVFLLGLALLAGFAAAEAADPNSKSYAREQMTGDAELHPEKSKDELRFTGIFPPGVKTIACISPASYPGGKAHKRGLELLQKAGFKLKVMPHAFTPPEKGKPGAPLEDRLADFYAAWNDPEVDMILCVRGGRGCRELLEHLDWTKLKPRKELYLQGYSDVTQITAAMLRKGCGRPVAGPMSGSLAGLAPECLQESKAMHHGEQVGPVPVRPLVPGDCAGLPFAGLLSRLAWVATSNYCPDMTGRIIFIEGVSSTPENVRSDLQLLLDRKFFAGAKAVVYCHFLRCGDRKEIKAILEEFAPKFGVPVYRGFPFGHSSKCFTIDFSRPVEIKNNTVIFPATAKP